VALLLVPLYFNVYSQHIFEPDKAYLLRAVSGIIAGMGVVVWLQKKPWARSTQSKFDLKQVDLISVCLVCYGGVYLLSTLLSVAPAQSFWGSYERGQGAYTLLGYLVIFLAIRYGMRSQDAIERAITVIIIGSLPVILLGALQWIAQPGARISGTMGNPMFVGAHLTMVAPLTLARLSRAWHQYRQFTNPTSPSDLKPKAKKPTAATALENQGGRSVYVVELALYALISGGQLLALFFSQSRGAWIGFAAGTATWFLLWAVVSHRRRLVMRFLGLCAAAFVLLCLINLPFKALEPLREVPYIGRLARVWVQGESGEVRLLIWQTVADALKATPARAILGHGPETLGLISTPFVKTALRGIEGMGARPDRAHSQGWDIVISCGFAGLLIYLSLLYALVARVLKTLQLIDNSRKQRVFALLCMGNSLLLLMVVALMGLWWLGVMLPLGILLGLWMFLGWRTWYNTETQTAQEKATPQAWNGSSIIFCGTFAALISHIVEAQVGFATTTTALLFWALCGVLVVQSTLTASPAPLQTVSKTAPVQFLFTPYNGAISGLFLAVCVFDFYRPLHQPQAMTAFGWPFPHSPLWVVVPSWLLAQACLWIQRFREILTNRDELEPNSHASDEMPNSKETPVKKVGKTSKAKNTKAPVQLPSTLKPDTDVRQHSRNDALWFFAGSLLLPAVMVLWHSRNVSAAESNAFEAGVVYVVASVWAIVFLSILAIALALFPRHEPGTFAVWCRNALPAMLVSLATFLASWPFNGRPIQADVLYRWGLIYDSARDDEQAHRLYDAALQLQPNQPVYLQQKARVLYLLAQSKSGTGAGDPLFEEAKTALQSAHALAPLNVDYITNLARLHVTWAKSTSNTEERTTHLQSAGEYFADATKMSPQNPGLWQERSETASQLGQIADAQRFGNIAAQLSNP
jgi:hypothetical protein